MVDHHRAGRRAAARLAAVPLAVAALLAACSDDVSTRSADAPETTDERVAPASTTSVAPLPTAAPYVSDAYADPAHWLCRPDRTDDWCDGDLDATVVGADGTTALEPFRPAEDPPVDCFYVYPTISGDPGATADLVADASEGWAGRNQAARFGTVCRVFAPVYRQITLAALFGGVTATPEDRELGYADVADAWRHYLANDNGGRGVVLVGHSQGAGVLNRLIREEIDPDAGERARLVSALLIGSGVRIPTPAADSGGDFANVGVCRTAEQVGCVISYATFSDTEPPPAETRFGKPREGDGSVVCANPAALGGGTGKLTSYLPADTVRALLPPDVELSTPYVKFDQWADATCRVGGGLHWLEAAFPDGDDARPDGFPPQPTPTWGLHLLDVGLAHGNLVDVVQTQAAAWARGR